MNSLLQLQYQLLYVILNKILNFSFQVIVIYIFDHLLFSGRYRRIAIYRRQWDRKYIYKNSLALSKILKCPLLAPVREYLCTKMNYQAKFRRARNFTLKGKVNMTRKKWKNKIKIQTYKTNRRCHCFHTNSFSQRSLNIAFRKLWHVYYFHGKQFSWYSKDGAAREEPRYLLTVESCWCDQDFQVWVTAFD